MATVVKQSCNSVDSSPFEQAGPFLIGKELTPVNAAPVKIIKEYLGKRPGSDEVVLLKVLAAKKADYADSDKAEEIRQGKMLLHTEFSILSLLHGMPGICRHHGLFKDKLPVAGSEEEIERVILALDCYHPHVYNDTSGERVNLQQHVIKQKRLSEKEALKLFHEIVTIISKMHAVSILCSVCNIQYIPVFNMCIVYNIFCIEQYCTPRSKTWEHDIKFMVSGV